MKRLVLFVGAAFLFNAPVALADTISIPEFDTKVYCKKMAGMAGGSAMIEETCREAEAMSKAKSARYPANPRLENICRKQAEFAGGSYQIFETCLEMETQSMDRLAKQDGKPAPSAAPVAQGRQLELPPLLALTPSELIYGIQDMLASAKLPELTRDNYFVYTLNVNGTGARLFFMEADGKVASIVINGSRENVEQGDGLRAISVLMMLAITTIDPSMAEEKNGKLIEQWLAQAKANEQAKKPAEMVHNGIKYRCTMKEGGGMSVSLGPVK